MAELRDVTDQTFATDVLASAAPVLVDFWGDHCPACRQISPILQQLASELHLLAPILGLLHLALHF